MNEKNKSIWWFRHLCGDEMCPSPPRSRLDSTCSRFDEIAAMWHDHLLRYAAQHIPSMGISWFVLSVHLLNLQAYESPLKLSATGSVGVMQCPMTAGSFDRSRCQPFRTYYFMIYYCHWHKLFLLAISRRIFESQCWAHEDWNEFPWRGERNQQRLRDDVLMSQSGQWIYFAVSNFIVFREWKVLNISEQ